RISASCSDSDTICSGPVKGAPSIKQFTASGHDECGLPHIPGTFLPWQAVLRDFALTRPVVAGITPDHSGRATGSPASGFLEWEPAAESPLPTHRLARCRQMPEARAPTARLEQGPTDDATADAPGLQQFRAEASLLRSGAGIHGHAMACALCGGRSRTDRPSHDGRPP